MSHLLDRNKDTHELNLEIFPHRNIYIDRHILTLFLKNKRLALPLSLLCRSVTP